MLYSIDMNISNKDKAHLAGLKAVKILHSNNFKGFWVGGVVRDLILGRTSDNIDIATNATPDKVEAIFVKEGYKTKLVGKKYGTILTVINGFPVEITTYRKEGDYIDKRHPNQIVFVENYTDDAQRRDFTINALYFNPITKELLDPCGGLIDLNNKLIKFIGNPKKRIEEDYLRLIRAARLSHQLGFRIEQNSFAAIKTRAKFLQDVAGERVKQEIDKILLSPNPHEGLKILDSLGLLKFIIPEVEKTKKVFHKSKTYHLEGSVFEHTLLVVSHLKNLDLNLIYAAIFHDVGKINTGKLKQRDGQVVMSFYGHSKSSQEIYNKFAVKFKPSRTERKIVNWLIEHHDLKRNFLQSKPEKQAIYALHPQFESLLDLWRADSAGNIKTDANKVFAQSMTSAWKLGTQYVNKIKELKNTLDLATGNNAIKILGIKPGPAIGSILKKIKAKIILGEVKNYSDLEKYLLSGRKNT